MNLRQRGICARFKECREKLGWSQPDFAAALGITLDQLASIEYARTPLRYGIAWKMRLISGLSLDWLATGGPSPDMANADTLSSQYPNGPSNDALLSEVFDVACPLTAEHLRKRQMRSRVKLDDADMRQRSFIEMMLKGQLRLWLSRAPAGSVKDLSDSICKLCEEFLAHLPAELKPVVDARFDELVWNKMRAELSIQRIPNISTPNLKLTDAATYSIVAEVKAQLPSLLERLEKATAESGKKSELAEFLARATKANVPLASVSRWLSGEREPGGEVALLLDVWATAQGYPRAK